MRNYPYHKSPLTWDIMKLFPSWMDMSSNTESNGWKFMNVIGQEVELLYREIQYFIENTRVSSADTRLESWSYKCTIESDFPDVDELTSASGIPIYRRRDLKDYLFDLPTRIEMEELYVNPFNVPSGIPSGITGMCYSATNENEGIYTIHVNQEPWKFNTEQEYDDNFVLLDYRPVDKKDQSYESVGYDEIIDTKSIYDLSDEFRNTILEYVEGGLELAYEDSEDNPEGEGVYDRSTVDLDHIPISGTLEISDMIHLDDAGDATIIPKYPSGQPVYSNTVTEPYNPGSGRTHLFDTYWKYQGSGITDTIVIHNPVSNSYIAEYSWYEFDKYGPITMRDSLHNVGIYSNLLEVTKDNNKANIEAEHIDSNHPTGTYSWRTDPDVLHPPEDSEHIDNLIADVYYDFIEIYETDSDYEPALTETIDMERTTVKIYAKDDTSSFDYLDVVTNHFNIYYDVDGLHIEPDSEIDGVNCEVHIKSIGYVKLTGNKIYVNSSLSHHALEDPFEDDYEITEDSIKPYTILTIKNEDIPCVVENIINVKFALQTNLSGITYCEDPRNISRLIDKSTYFVGEKGSNSIYEYSSITKELLNILKPATTNYEERYRIGTSVYDFEPINGYVSFDIGPMVYFDGIIFIACDDGYDQFLMRYDPYGEQWIDTPDNVFYEFPEYITQITDMTIEEESTLTIVTSASNLIKYQLFYDYFIVNDERELFFREEYDGVLIPE